MVKDSKNISIVFLDESTIGQVANIGILSTIGKYTSYELTNPEETIHRISYNQVVITNKVRIDKSVMDSCKELKLICVAATGMNNVDLEYASMKGITVKNVSGYSTESVAQTTFSMLFYLLNKLSYFDNYVKSGAYSQNPMFTHHGRNFWEIKGKRFGIIGLGTIGKRVAEIAEAFGAEVVYFSTSGKNNNQNYKRVELEELLKTSDIISIHCPLNSGTENLLNKKSLQLMKSTAILLNTGRGKIVNENDLADALNSGQIAAAGLDVFEKEPLQSDSLLMNIENKDKIVLTPHIAWTSIEAREKLVSGIFKNIKEWMENQQLPG
jgi:lactate dehydrogenase-like 2-hydroxyacid dehydrogenase